MKQKTIDIVSRYIDMALSESMGLPPDSASCAGWVSPDAATFYSVEKNGGEYADIFHAVFVKNNPAIFGISSEQFNNVMKRWHSRHDKKGKFDFIDSEESDELQQIVYKNGWVRVRYYGGEWHFTVDNIKSPKNKKTLELMAQKISTNKYPAMPAWTANTGLDAVISSIDDNGPSIELTIHEIAHGFLEENCEPINKLKDKIL